MVFVHLLVGEPGLRLPFLLNGLLWLIAQYELELEKEALTAKKRKGQTELAEQLLAVA